MQEPGLTMKYGLLIPVLCATLVACSPIYTPPVGWVSTPDTKGDLRSNLTPCVAEYDPAHLPEMDKGNEYQVSGLFVNTSRTAPVVDCMASKGWTADGFDNGQ